MKIQFKMRVGMPCFDGPGGHWNPDQVKDVPEDMALRLLGLNKSPFIKPGEGKAFQAPADKMIHGAPENKGAEIKPPEDLEDKIADDLKVPKGIDKTKSRLFGKRGK